MASSCKVSLKLLVETKSKKVLFAVAGKEFVDFVFSLLTLPIGAVPKVLHPDSRELLLFQGGATAADVTSSSSPMARFKMYTCRGQCVTVTMDSGAQCPQCKQAMATDMTFVLPSAPAVSGGLAGNGGAAAGEESGGYVKGLVTYMVTDGLELTPMSAISSITLINKFSVGKDVELAEKFVSIGMDEGLGLLKAALRSDTVLSDVFLGRNK
ncbi:hypothetical protein QOZ80_5AG0407620 [Eleusine coracana subsp. coracana]|nr:hypothetical protein QOZ80_5AG0407620 [Eleusine coracana subsp. coracana]